MNVMFMHFALGYFDAWSRVEVLMWTTVVFATQVCASLWWTSRFGMGPVESLWRRLTYGRA